jgi:hypothetical protein
MRPKYIGLIIMLIIAPMMNSSAVELAPGDLLSAVALNQSAAHITILRVDPVTGDRTVISGPINSGGGTVVGEGPAITRNSGRDVGLTYADGAIWVSTSAGGKYFHVDPASGDRTIISGCPSNGSFPCRDSLIGNGPDVNQTWALTVVPSDPDPEQIISGCIQKNGTLKIVNDPVECSDRETPISLLGAP